MVALNCIVIMIGVNMSLLDSEALSTSGISVIADEQMHGNMGKYRTNIT